MPSRASGDRRPGPGARLSRRVLARPADELAPFLLGQVLVRVLPDGQRLAGAIVETEAYLGVPDRAAHTHGGRRTARVEPMWGRPGTAYVYFTYGMHHCFNVSAGQEGVPVAVLVRALEPIEGLERMRAHRATPNRGIRRPRDTDLCSGPAKLCQALAIDRGLSGEDLTTSGRVWLETGSQRVKPDEMERTKRVGVDYAGEWAEKPLRWYVRGNPHVSVLRKGPGAKPKKVEPDRG